MESCLQVELTDAQAHAKSQLESLLEFFKDSLKGELISRRGLQVEFAIHDADTRLSHVLKTLEATKLQSGIEAYEVSHPSMEQVYLAILRQRG